MILRRLGNKKKLMPLLLPHFPPHKTWIEPFFGSGSAFFYKPKAQYNIVNDLDSDVFNLFQVVMNQKEELEKAFYLMPIHSDLLKYWKNNQETDPIKKALRFLFLSNFTIHGAGGMLTFKAISNDKESFLKNLDNCFEMIESVLFNNEDFRIFFKGLSFTKTAFGLPSTTQKDNSFCYIDPPYLSTTDYYSHSFKEQDCIDLFDCVQKIGVKFAYSEFDNPFILQQAQERNLNVIHIGERQNLKNRRTEILVTNYQNTQLSLFDK